MIAVVAVTGEDTTGGVSAGGKHDAQRELLPVEKRIKSTGDSAVFVHCVFPSTRRGSGCLDDRFCDAPGDRLPETSS